MSGEVLLDTFRVSHLPDAGSFAQGDSAALAWDVLHKAGRHSTPDVIDFSSCTHLKPYSIACLCGMALKAQVDGKTIRAIPPVNTGCASHLARLGVPGFFEGEWDVSEACDTNITVKKVAWPPGSEGERVVEVLAPRTDLPSGVFPRMVEGLDEIVLNALTHSGSLIDCVVAGQAFPATDKVEVAVLDFGCTIRNHLTSNPKYAQLSSDLDALTLALEDGVTGTPTGSRNARGEQNSGAGLAYLKEYCEAGGGELTVLSGDSWITVGADIEPITGRLHQRFEGSLVNIRYFTKFGLHSAAIEPIL